MIPADRSAPSALPAAPLVFGALAVLLAATRVHHFAAIPDASWAVFFLGGLYLHRHARRAFPALMALAVLVDWAVIRGQGLSFWQHYCVSPAYWCLIGAYLLLWAGGAWVARRPLALDLRTVGRLALAVVASAAACQLVAQGSFYWISASVADPTVAGWWKNYTDWLPAYLGTMALYVAVTAAVHAAALQLAAATAQRRDRTA